jgi:hypothetical protein
MRHLAGTGDIPAIFMMKRMTDLAFNRTAWVITCDDFEAVRTTMLLINSELYFMLAMQGVPCARP